MSRSSKTPCHLVGSEPAEGSNQRPSPLTQGARLSTLPGCGQSAALRRSSLGPPAAASQPLRERPARSHSHRPAGVQTPGRGRRGPGCCGSPPPPGGGCGAAGPRGGCPRRGGPRGGGARGARVAARRRAPPPALPAQVPWSAWGASSRDRSRAPRPACLLPWSLCRDAPQDPRAAGRMTMAGGGRTGGPAKHVSGEYCPAVRGRGAFGFDTPGFNVRVYSTVQTPPPLGTSIRQNPRGSAGEPGARLLPRGWERVGRVGVGV